MGCVSCPNCELERQLRRTAEKERSDYRARAERLRLIVDKLEAKLINEIEGRKAHARWIAAQMEPR